MRFWHWLRSRDPHGAALRRAARAAVVVPVNFAIGSELIGNVQVATFAAFGSFALLMFVNFTGSLAGRFGSYAMLALFGAGFVALGTVVTSPDWLAVVAMAAVSFLVIFAGSVSSTTAAAGQAALLTFILPVLVPGPVSVIPQRLAGWAIACGVCIPVVLFIWPPTEQYVLRGRTAEMCRALAAMLRLEQPAPGEGDSLVAVMRARAALRESFRTSAARPAALSLGSRLVVRAVDELEWLSAIVVNACSDAPETWPPRGQELRAAATRVMQACADLLDGSGSSDELSAHLADLDRARVAVADETLAELRRSAGSSDDVVAGELERPLYAAHQLGFAVAVVGETVTRIVIADARSWLARILGRRPAIDEPGAISAAEQVATGHLDRHSVWLQNSVRAAAGLAFAVLLARISGAQQAFWIGLGALSVLRSNALSTGGTVARALLGTLIGFVIGGALVAAIGTDHAVLWTLMPIVILIAAFVPQAISFTAGQVGFTVFTIILFNILAPAGWQIGVVRIEDVALGCLASVVAGALFWPRGAGPALAAALDDAYRTSADYLAESVEALTARRPTVADTAGLAEAAATRLDDAFRQYLAERGAKQVSLESVTALTNGAARVRLAGSAVRQLSAAPQEVDDDLRLRATIGVLDRSIEKVADWYRSLATGFSTGAECLPVVDGPSESFLDVVLPAVERCGDAARASRAERLLWAGQYLGDVSRLRTKLIGPAEQVRDARTVPWWSLRR